VHHCAFSHPACASSTLAILSIVSCSRVTSCACGHTVGSIRLFQCPGAHSGSEFSFRSFFRLLLGSLCSLAAMKDPGVVFPDILPAVQPASPASAMSMSLLIGGCSIITPIGLLPSWVSTVTDFLAVDSRRSRTASFARPGKLEVSFRGQLDARGRMPMSVCRSLPRLLRCFEVSVFLPPPSLHPNPLNWVDLRTRCLMLTRPLSTDAPRMPGVSSQVQFRVRNQSVKLYISCQIIEFARYTVIYLPLFSRECSKFSANISLNEILRI